MASKEELYVSVSPESYRNGKRIILSSQTHLLTTIKHLRNLKFLSRQKRDLKIKFNRLISSVISDIEDLQKKIPHKKLPNSLDKKTKTIGVIDKKFNIKNDSIDKELKIIQEKLRRLNAAA